MKELSFNDLSLHSLPPGKHIQKSMEAKNWSQEELAQILKISPKYLSELINDKKSLTPELIKMLAIVFGENPIVLMNLETIHRLNKAKVDEENLKKRVKISDLIPFNEIIKKGWLVKTSYSEENTTPVLEFLGVKNLEQLQEELTRIEETHPISFRQSEKLKENISRKSVFSWILAAKSLSSKIKIGKYKREKLEEIVDKIHTYTTDEAGGVEEFLNDINKAGVKFLLLSHLQKTFLDGAAFFDGSNPVIVYTARYDRLDNFWFTITHEIGHILFHINEASPYIVDSLDSIANENKEIMQKEKEANSFATNKLLLEKMIPYFESNTGYLLENRILECSKDLKIHKSIIVGLLAFYYKTKEETLPKISYSYLHKYSSKVKPYIPEKYKLETSFN